MVSDNYLLLHLLGFDESCVFFWQTESVHRYSSLYALPEAMVLSLLGINIFDAYGKPCLFFCGYSIVSHLLPCTVEENCIAGLEGEKSIRLAHQPVKNWCKNTFILNLYRFHRLVSSWCSIIRIEQADCAAQFSVGSEPKWQLHVAGI